MFTGPGSKSALAACEAQYAFQRNWFPDPIAGNITYVIQATRGRGEAPTPGGPKGHPQGGFLKKWQNGHRE